ncbi:hypothetical protein CABS03_04065 [Colletotrichum abscissum]|uniref:Uncharacterized protein n=1 Tax=Colletotrichum abscissum TaxID=1671311 RepID=A0A9P9XLQ6_9PEZI|nr:hypothetical protein CABS02_04293 [Colletotrichum abscissum]
MCVLGISDCDFKDNETRSANKTLGCEMQPLESPATLSFVLCASCWCWVISFGSPISRFLAKMIRHLLTVEGPNWVKETRLRARWIVSLRDPTKAEAQPDGALGEAIPHQRDPAMRAMALSNVDGRSARIWKGPVSICIVRYPCRTPWVWAKKSPKGRKLIDDALLSSNRL